VKRPLHVGVEAQNLLHDRRGMGRYVRSLLTELTRRHAGRVRITLLVPHLFVSRVARQLTNGYAPGTLEVARRTQAARLALDMAWFPWNGMTWLPPVPTLATVHDVWPFVSPARSARIRRNEQMPFLATAARASRIVADSHFSKAEIVKHLGFDPRRIDVVPLGVDRAQFAFPADAPPAPKPPYVLFAGEAEGRKDLGTLLTAMSLLPAALRERLPLVTAGKLPLELRRQPREFRLIAEGEIDDARLGQLYAGASVFVLPSLYEGYGLPILEAMAFGTPVIASRAASIPEVAGDAALYFPTGDAAALARAIEQVVTDGKTAARLRDDGLRRAASMPWGRCADSMVEIFEAVARDGAPA
jgi:glycosyltransferase involved in cell wall biosynthesis